MPSLKILFLTYQGDMAGSTNSIAMLAKALAEKGHQIYLGCRKESLIYQMLEGSKVKLIAMTFSGKIDFQNMQQIKFAVKKYSIQLINAQSSWDRYTSIFAKWLYKLPVKIIHTRRQRPLSMGGFLQNFLYNRGADGFVAVSNGVADGLQKMGLDHKKIKVINNGTPIEKYQNLDPIQTEKLRDKFEIKENDFVIGCVSRRKQQEQILQALAIVEFPVKMIFVGIRKEVDFEKWLEKLPAKHQVFFEGEIGANEILNYYPLFDIKILASNMEGLSQSLLEAMALGIPVIATDAAGNPDLIKREVNGLLFQEGNISELANAISLLYQNPRLRNKLAAKGKHSALVDFSLENTVKAYEKYFAEMLK